MNKIKFIFITLFTNLILLSCSMSDRTAGTVSMNGDRSLSYGNSLNYVSPEDQEKFINRFLSAYKLVDGTSFLVYENVFLTINPGSSFYAKNLGTVTEPDLTFELNIANASRPNEVVSLETDYSMEHKFEITSATTGDFFMVITTKSGQVIHKEMEIEVTKNSLLLDKVIIANSYIVPLTLESFSSRGIILGDDIGGYALIEHSENRTTKTFYKKRNGYEPSSWNYNSWNPQYSWEHIPYIQEVSSSHYSIGFTGTHMNIYLKSPLDNTRRILKTNIREVETISTSTGFSLRFREFQ